MDFKTALLIMGGMILASLIIAGLMFLITKPFKKDKSEKKAKQVKQSSSTGMFLKE